MFSKLQVLVALSLLPSILALPAPDPRATAATLTLPARLPMATHVVRKNTISLPVVRKHNFSGKNLLKSDQARAQFLKTRHLSKDKQSFDLKTAKNAAQSIGVGITNAVVTYTVDVRVFATQAHRV